MKLYDLLHYIGTGTKLFVEDENKKCLYEFNKNDIRALIKVDQRYVKEIRTGMFPDIHDSKHPAVCLVVTLENEKGSDNDTW